MQVAVTLWHWQEAQRGLKPTHGIWVADVVRGRQGLEDGVPLQLVGLF